MKSKALKVGNADQVSGQVMEVKKQGEEEADHPGFQDDEFFIRSPELAVADHVGTGAGGAEKDAAGGE